MVGEAIRVVYEEDVAGYKKVDKISDRVRSVLFIQVVHNDEPVGVIYFRQPALELSHSSLVIAVLAIDSACLRDLTRGKHLTHIIKLNQRI